jgi:hypothetical protein
MHPQIIHGLRRVGEPSVGLETRRCVWAFGSMLAIVMNWSSMDLRRCSVVEAGPKDCGEMGPPRGCSGPVDLCCCPARLDTLRA